MLKLYVTMQSMFIAGTDRLRGDNEKGATAVEYGIMVALIAVVIIVAVTTIGTTLLGKFNAVITGLGGTVG
ncbi:pilus assembly protein Flp/PilA [Arthrobacter alpinus]|uniref:Pilus assembly protein Flp/PilA n=1 Tax=Arthrobacter alpinus TaxID=656366 RepID=A0A1H5KN97_9MICC|nr:Flp family type IVb pilin [Arthrobacter alpinus]SEE65561.1 pilus assembly protein Flp/PilA [Arthrobacter alpinus]